MVGEGRRLAGGLLGPYRQDMIGRSDRTEALMTSLADMAGRGEAEAPHARATAAQLHDSLKVTYKPERYTVVKALSFMVYFLYTPTSEMTKPLWNLQSTHFNTLCP